MSEKVDDWERLALEAFADHCAKAFPRVHPDSLFAEPFKAPFVAGYLAAKSEQEAATRAAKLEVLVEAVVLVGTKSRDTFAERLEEAVNELLAKYTDPTEKSDG